MLADKTETLELYISILGLDKRYERTSITLDSRSFARRSWLTGTVSVGRKIEEGIGWREKEEMALLSFSSSIDRFGPLSPQKGRRIR